MQVKTVAGCLVWWTFTSIWGVFTSSGTVLDLGPDHKSGFSRVSVIKPSLYLGRGGANKTIQTTRQDKDRLVHYDDVTMRLDIDGQRHLLDLSLNRELLPKGYFERRQANGLHTVRTPEHHELELCHYQGRLRGVPDSWAAISTCYGLSGTVYDGQNLLYLAPGDGESHHLYRHADLTAAHSCGREDTVNRFPHALQVEKNVSKNIRVRRSVSVSEPCGADDRSRYVELVLVADRSQVMAHGSAERVTARLQELANIVNALYRPLNVFVTLAGTVVWTERDEVSITSNGDTLLADFLTYRRLSLLPHHPNDNAHLITKVQFGGGVVGKARVGAMCSPDDSGGVTSDFSPVAGAVAATLAHEMGHNLNMNHDTPDCHCPARSCLMAASSSSSSQRSAWSSCSVKAMKEGFDKGLDICLFNKPARLAEAAVCGNGWLEEGEECDCDTPCCDVSTCRFASNATCATGRCCDLQTCQLVGAGTVCRAAVQECDLPEYCDGLTGDCPQDVYLLNGASCGGQGQAHCYEGSCKGYGDQCESLWGPGVSSSDWECYQLNNRGDRYGNCGRIRQQQQQQRAPVYLKCEERDLRCGRLHCNFSGLATKPYLVSAAYHFYNSQRQYIYCRTGELDFGPDIPDQGLVPDGAPCGDGQMCVGQRCVSVASLLTEECAHNCSGRGVCNSRGHCHCQEGYGPPDCAAPGHGGSVDSGPMLDPFARRWFVVTLYLVFLVIVPTTSAILLAIHCTKNKSSLWHQRQELGKSSPCLGKICQWLSSPRRDFVVTRISPQVEMQSRSSDKNQIQVSTPAVLEPTVLMEFPTRSTGRVHLYENVKHTKPSRNENVLAVKSTRNDSVINVPAVESTRNDSAINVQAVKSMRNDSAINVQAVKFMKNHSAINVPAVESTRNDSAINVQAVKSMRNDSAINVQAVKSMKNHSAINVPAVESTRNDSAINVQAVKSMRNDSAINVQAVKSMKNHSAINVPAVESTRNDSAINVQAVKSMRNDSAINVQAVKSMKNHSAINVPAVESTRNDSAINVQAVKSMRNDSAINVQAVKSMKNHSAINVPAVESTRNDSAINVQAVKSMRNDSAINVPAVKSMRNHSAITVPAVKSMRNHSAINVQAVKSMRNDSAINVPAVKSMRNHSAITVPAVKSMRNHSAINVPAVKTTSASADVRSLVQQFDRSVVPASKTATKHSTSRKAYSVTKR